MMKKDEKVFVLLHLNMALMPNDRGDLFEDPLNEILQKEKVGEVTGGGTLLNFKGMPTACDIEFSIYREKLEKFMSFLHRISEIMGKGSYIEFEDKKEEIGVLEGLALILDAVHLDQKVYEENDINTLLKGLDDDLKDVGSYHSYYNSDEATYLYFYGESYDKMNKLLKEVVHKYPLCEKCQIVTTESLKMNTLQ
ncbi:MAG: hypothetical protein K2M17_04625 [Bacilli bacterium]|nr:hypothetical protein [Bacilli bacterium]